MRTIGPRPPATDEPDTHRLVLRDGSAAKVRIAEPGDREAMRLFFEGLSPESRYKRFFSLAAPPPELLDRFCDAAHPSQHLSLIALRRVDQEERIVAVASYMVVREATAEVAFAIDDRFHRKGIGTLLLEQLAVKAVDHGVREFVATTFMDNAAMREVFRDSGFQVGASLTGGEVDVQLTLTPSAEGVALAERRRRIATVESLRPLLAPRSVAVIGASNDRKKIGGRLLRSLIEGHFAGDLHVVHPRQAEVQGVPACRSARDLPPGVDAAIIAVPREAVLAVVDDCAAAGVKSLVVITAGYAETGPEGRAEQDALVDKVRGYGMRLIGPNCMGLLNLNPAVRLHASFSPVVPPPGRVAFSSQSGALGIAVAGMARERHLGLSSFVSVGNKADVSGNDLLEYWEEDPGTAVILLYLESFGNPRRFARIARRVGRRKPIVALKAGRTAAGVRAAGSHTAALAASDVAVDALFRQTGVMRVQTIDELFDVAECLDAQPLPPGDRVTIITNAGGPGILAADACEGAALTVAELSARTREQLARVLPATASVTNPIDMIASAGPAEYGQTIAIALAAPETDAVLVIVTPVDRSRTDDIIRSIGSAVARARESETVHKPVLTCVVAESPRPAQVCAGAERIPTYTFPENAIRALGLVSAYARWRDRPAGALWDFEDLNVDEARAICRRALHLRGETWLTAVETAGVLRAVGVAVPASGVARSPDEAAAMATTMGFPVAAKLASIAATHKTELGAVRLNLDTPEAVHTAYADIVKAAHQIPADQIEGVIVQAMVSGGVEMLVGVTHDPLFGPLVGFGTGGVNVEIWRDVQFRIAPLTDRDADEMMREIRGFRLLEGHRGHRPADLVALRELILRISRLAEDVHEIAELDLNPVMALPDGQGCRVVDARIRVR